MIIFKQVRPDLFRATLGQLEIELGPHRFDATLWAPSTELRCDECPEARDPETCPVDDGCEHYVSESVVVENACIGGLGSLAEVETAGRRWCAERRLFWKRKPEARAAALRLASEEWQLQRLADADRGEGHP